MKAGARGVIFISSKPHLRRWDIDKADTYSQLIKVPCITINDHAGALLSQQLKLKELRGLVVANEEVQHGWEELHRLSDVGSWPSSQKARKRLYQRLKQNHAGSGDRLRHLEGLFAQAERNWDDQEL